MKNFTLGDKLNNSNKLYRKGSFISNFRFFHSLFLLTGLKLALKLIGLELKKFVPSFSFKFFELILVLP